MLTLERLDVWIAALESGQFKQHQFKLVDNMNNPTEYCCLAVLSSIFSVTDSKGRLIYPDDCELTRLPHSIISTLLTLNDTGQPDQYGKVIQYLKKLREQWGSV